MLSEAGHRDRHRRFLQRLEWMHVLVLMQPLIQGGHVLQNMPLPPLLLLLLLHILLLFIGWDLRHGLKR